MWRGVQHVWRSIAPAMELRKGLELTSRHSSCEQSMSWKGNAAKVRLTRGKSKCANLTAQ